MVDSNLALLLKYPLISIEEDNTTKHYKGVVSIDYRDFDLHIVEQIRDNTPHFQIRNEIGDKIDLNGIKATNILEFLDAVTAKLTVKTPRNLVNSYKRILHEYSEFTNFYLNVKSCSLSQDLSSVNIAMIDDGGRRHVLEISIDFNEIKDIFRPHNLQIPEQFCKDLEKNSSNLNEIYHKYLSAIDDLQGFFDVMDALDTSCCVLDPEEPNRRDCHRRIWLDQNLSVMVLVDPMNVKARPDLKFLGPERVILQYRQKLNEKLEQWDENCNFIQGLLNILEIENFPMKPEENREILMDVGECSICFSSRLNDKLPEVVCGNKSCENFYHTECLYEWLTSVDSKRIFNQIRGQCPNCEKGISCPLPE